MKRLVIILIVVCLAVLTFAGAAFAAKKGTYFPPGSKLEVSVDTNRYVTVSWPDVVGDYDHWAAGYASKKAGTSGAWSIYEDVNTYTFVGPLSPGKWEITVSVRSETAELDSLKTWVTVP